jgi:hypothetical protein
VPAASRHRRLVAAALAAVVAAGCAAEAASSPSPAPERAAPPAEVAELESVGGASAPQPESATTEVAPTTTEAPAPIDIHDLRPPPPAADPAALAAMIVEGEAVIADPDAAEADLAAAGLALQTAYRQLGDRADWDDAVRATLPGELHAKADRHAAARREFLAMHSRFSDTLPAWQIVAPEPIDELMGHYLAAQEEFGVRWEHLASINLVETGMGRIRGYSSAGARGPMQFMPATWAAYGEGDIDSPVDSIRAAARYLSTSGYHHDLDGALFAYNRDNRYVRGIKHYADLMIEDPRAFVALYHWGIVYRSEHGDVYLPVGFAEPERIPVLDYLAR